MPHGPIISFMVFSLLPLYGSGEYQSAIFVKFAFLQCSLPHLFI